MRICAYDIQAFNTTSFKLFEMLETGHVESRLSSYIDHSGSIKFELLTAKPEQEVILNKRDPPCHDISERVGEIRFFSCLVWTLICSGSQRSPAKEMQMQQPPAPNSHTHKHGYTTVVWW